MFGSTAPTASRRIKIKVSCGIIFYLAESVSIYLCSIPVSATCHLAKPSNQKILWVIAQPYYLIFPWLGATLGYILGGLIYTPWGERFHLELGLPILWISLFFPNGKNSSILPLTKDLPCFGHIGHRVYGLSPKKKPFPKNGFLQIQDFNFCFFYHFYFSTLCFQLLVVL